MSCTNPIHFSKHGWPDSILHKHKHIRAHRVFPNILQGGPKNVALYFCPYLHQLLINFQNSSTGTLCGQFAIM